MYPENQPQPPQQNNYDFIMNSGGSKRPSLLSGGGSGRQLLLIAAGVVVFIILLFAVGTLLTHKDSSAIDRLTKLAQEQTEIAHISGIAGSNGSANAQSLKNFAQTASLTMTTDQQNIVSFLAKNGVGVKADTLTALQDPAVDQKLQDATAASNFDAVFQETVGNMLDNYESSLKQAYSLSKSATEKQLLSTDFNNAELLKKQLTQKEF